MQCTETISTSSFAGQGKIDIVPISHKLFHAKDTARKTVSNGSRVPCMKTWNPINNKKFETLSHLPTPSEESIAKQIDYMLTNGWIPCLEFDDVRAALRLVNFMHARSRDQRITELDMCPQAIAGYQGTYVEDIGRYGGSHVRFHKFFPGAKRDQPVQKGLLSAYIRCLAFDNKHQMKCMAFLVQKPPTDYSST